ncbi:MAG: HDOD domain-containing protein [Gammaproteobacteria bacterium]
MSGASPRRELPIPPAAAALARETARLASFPAVWLALREAIEDPGSSLDDVCDILRRDPALVAGLLRIANSAWLGHGRQAASLPQAASLLGMFRIHDLVLATSVMRAFPRVPAAVFDMGRFWHASLLAATAARRLADAEQIVDSDRVFLHGLLAQIGRLVALLRRPDDCRALLAETGGRLRGLDALERQRWGYDYADLGAALIDAWGLPAEFALPVFAHVAPGRRGASSPIAGLTHVAVVIAVGIDADDEVADIAAAVEFAIWERYALTPASFTELVDRTRSEAAGLANLFVAA